MDIILLVGVALPLWVDSSGPSSILFHILQEFGRKGSLVWSLGFIGCGIRAPVYIYTDLKNISIWRSVFPTIDKCKSSGSVVWIEG